MSDKIMPEKDEPTSERFLGLTEGEIDSLKRLLRYAFTIFGAVALTLVVVALLSSLLGG